MLFSNLSYTHLEVYSNILFILKSQYGLDSKPIEFKGKIPISFSRVLDQILIYFVRSHQKDPTITFIYNSKNIV